MAYSERPGKPFRSLERCQGTRMHLVAGTAARALTPDPGLGLPGVELMGYGARSGVSTGVHDPLLARALYLAPRESPELGIVLAAADLCLLAPAQAREIRERITAATGVPEERILVSCTHTHSAPDTGLGALMRGESAPAHVSQILDSIVAAATEAVASQESASFRWGRAEARIGANRRIAHGPVDPEVLVLCVNRANGEPLAVLFNYACHGTVLGHDNLEISADWPGVACAAIERETGANALFLLGAHADIDPRTRGLMDLAIAGQSRGLGFDAVQVLGSEVAEAVLGAIRGNGAAPQTGPIGAATTVLRLPVHLGGLSMDAAARALDERKRELAIGLDIAPEALPRLSELDAAVFRSVHDLPAREARERIAQARLYLRDKTAPFFAGGTRELEVEVQVLRIGDCALLGVPLEPTTEVGIDWKTRARGQFKHAAVLGIANGWIRYLPHARDLEHPLAHQHYEVLSSLLEAGAAERILDAAEALLAS